MSDTKPLPKYLCHKEVRALKITRVERVSNHYVLHFAEEGYAPLEVESGWIDKHGPKAGGYFVAYADGYRSFSPARTFEEGYRPVQE